MSKKDKTVRLYTNARYQFVLFITNKKKGVICQRYFEANKGLKTDIQEATEVSMDLIYSDILLKSMDTKPTLSPNPSVLSLAVYDNEVEVASVHQPLSTIKNSVRDINIKELVKDIFDLLRK